MLCLGLWDSRVVEHIDGLHSNACVGSSEATLSKDRNIMSPARPNHRSARHQAVQLLLADSRELQQDGRAPRDVNWKCVRLVGIFAYGTLSPHFV